MSDQAIILIPDISGFTDFTSATEIDHSAHIITELPYKPNRPLSSKGTILIRHTLKPSKGIFRL